MRFCGSRMSTGDEAADLSFRFPSSESSSRMRRGWKHLRAREAESVIFTETKLPGALLIDPEQFEDERGFFARCWSEEEFAERGLNPRSIETNISFNRREGTLRGMHFQIAPHAQPKLVRCTAGAIYDVFIDLRPESSTFKQWTAVDLNAANHRQLYVP